MRVSVFNCCAHQLSPRSFISHHQSHKICFHILQNSNLRRLPKWITWTLSLTIECTTHKKFFFHISLTVSLILLNTIIWWMIFSLNYFRVLCDFYLYIYIVWLIGVTRKECPKFLLFHSRSINFIVRLINREKGKGVSFSHSFSFIQFNKKNSSSLSFRSHELLNLIEILFSFWNKLSVWLFWCWLHWENILLSHLICCLL